jgi:hypothetical protein
VRKVRHLRRDFGLQLTQTVAAFFDKMRSNLLDSDREWTHKMKCRNQESEQSGRNGGAAVLTTTRLLTLTAGANGPDQHTRDESHSRRAHLKGVLAVLYGEPDTSRFLAAVQRLKKQQRQRERLTRQAKQRVRAALRKMREC